VGASEGSIIKPKKSTREGYLRHSPGAARGGLEGLLAADEQVIVVVEDDGVDVARLRRLLRRERERGQRLGPIEFPLACKKGGQKGREAKRFVFFESVIAGCFCALTSEPVWPPLVKTLTKTAPTRKPTSTCRSAELEVLPACCLHTTRGGGKDLILRGSALAAQKHACSLPQTHIIQPQAI
jgi:hypothetical protein